MSDPGVPTITPDGSGFRGSHACDVCGGPIGTPGSGRGAAGRARARRCSPTCRLTHERRRKALRRGPGSPRLVRMERLLGLAMAELWAEKKERVGGP